MKKLKLFFACLLMAVLSIGQVWADDPAAQGATLFSEDFSSYSKDDVPSGTVTTATGRVVYGNANVTYACTNGESGSATAIYADALATGTSPEIMIGKYGSGGSTGGSFSVTGIPSGGAQEITVSFKQNKQKLKVAVAGTGYTSDGVDAKPANAGTVSFDITVGDGADPTFDLTFSVYSSNVRVDDILVTVKTAGEGGAPAKTLSSVAVSGTPTKTSYYAGDNFDPAGLTVTGTYSDESTAPITSGITWAYDPSQTLALNQTSIGVIATVSEISSPKFNVTGLTVTEAPAADNYEKVTGEPADWSGEYILVYEADATNARVWKGEDQANNYAEATITDGVIAAPEDAAVLNIAKVAESDPVVYTIMLGEKYIGQTSNANGIKIQDDAINNSISYNGTDAAVDIVASSAHLRYNSASSSYFRYYKSSSYSSQKKIQLYKKVDGTVKPSAELSYAAADQKKLTKLGDAFTAPELSNPHSVAVSYASNNTDVADVASNGAVTIKAAGVAVITASFAGNDDYKEGSASYTIGVTTHAGTEADPYVAADAKIAIDAMGTIENAYATGIVSNVVTTTLPQEGYITFYFSADGLTSGQQVEAYKCYGLNSAPFEAVSDVVTGATVVVTGTLKKYNSTYEFDQNCHLVSYTAPAAEKTHIANTKETAYTVAQAITYAADGITYDLDDYVYVAGVVYDVKSFNNGAMNIFIKDANAENQFELFKCAGINDGNATTPFEALTDVQVGNIVIGYGQLTVYNTTYEFKQGNYLVDLQKPVTGVQLDATAEVEVGSTVNLTATILPSNATGTIVWSVESGDTYASVDENGVVTGNAEGEATIRATVQGTAFYAECTVTITPEAAPVAYDYALVTDAAQLQDGLKVIIVAAEEDKAAGSAAATYRNVVDVERTTDGNYLILDSENMPTEFTLGVSGNNFTFNDGDGYMYESAAKSVKVQDEAFEWTITIGEGNVATIQATNELRYNSTSPRFTTYASGQQALQLYVKNDGKQPAGLAWSTDAVELTVGDDFEAPTLTNPNNLVVTITSDNEEVATVSEGIVSLVTDATGTATITASYAGDETYRAASVSYTITVNATEPTPAETKNVVILAEYNSKFYAMTNSLASGALAAVEVEKDGEKIVVFAEADKAAIQWTMTDNTTTATFQDSEDKYLAHTGTGTSLALQDAAEDWTWDSENGCYYMVVDSKDRAFMYYKDGIFKNYATSNLAPDKTDYSGAPEIIEIAAEDIILSEKADAELAYTPSEVTLTVGGAFTPAVLNYAEGFDGLAAVTYASNNEDVATVDESGVVSLVADAIGTATITATFAGNNNYLAGSASYTITVNEAGDDLSGTWVLASSVAAGDKIIIMGANNADIYTMGKQNTNNRAAVASTLSEDVLNPGAATKVFTLVDAGGGKFAIQASNGNYLTSATSGTSNNLLEAADYELDNAKWTITIENGSYSIVAAAGSKTVMQYNSGSTIFSCYGSASQKPVKIFKRDAAPEPPVVDYTEVRNGLNCGEFYTMCLDKAVTAVRGGIIWRVVSKSDNSANPGVILEEVDLPLDAGRPYIFRATAGILEVAYTGDAVLAPITEGNNGLVGSFEKASITADDNNYIIYNNELYFVNSGNVYVGANRAYLKMSAVPVYSEPQMGNAPRRRITMAVHGEQTTTGCENIKVSEKPMKLMIDGNIYVLRGEKMYDTTGRLVK